MTQTADRVAEEYVHDPRRRLELAGVSNFRDVGGYPVDGGASVRWRTLFRSDALSRLDPASLAVVNGLGLRTVIDLRSQPEVDGEPNPLAGPTTHIPLLTDFENVPTEAGPLARYVVDECGDQIAAAIGALSRRGALPALVNCGVGKDRTGVVIGLTLAAVGVPDELIAADYAVSAGYLAQDPSVATWPPGEVAKLLASSPPTLMLATLGRVRELGGSPAGYLRAHRLTQSSLERLRSTLIDRPPPGRARPRGRARSLGRPAVGPVERS